MPPANRSAGGGRLADDLPDRRVDLLHLIEIDDRADRAVRSAKVIWPPGTLVQ
jgi:hypothetical protein